MTSKTEWRQNAAELQTATALSILFGRAPPEPVTVSLHLAYEAPTDQHNSTAQSCKYSAKPRSHNGTKLDTR